MKLYNLIKEKLLHLSIYLYVTLQVNRMTYSEMLEKRANLK